jgi:putative ABC transport system substrate-binding protein
MDRRRFLLTSLAGALVGPLSTEAQQAARIPRVGVLAPGAGPRPGSPLLPQVEAFVTGLREHGYVVGKTVALEIRWDKGSPEVHAQQAKELIAGGVDAIVASTTASTLAARSVTRTTPIVMAAFGGGDPVELGLAASFGRPGGNVTGVSLLTHMLPGKRLELLKELIPGLSNVALIWNPTRPGQTDVTDHERVAHALGLKIFPFEVRRADDFGAAFQGARQARAQGRPAVRRDAGGGACGRHRRAVGHDPA